MKNSLESRSFGTTFAKLALIGFAIIFTVEACSGRNITHVQVLPPGLTGQTSDNQHCAVLPGDYMVEQKIDDFQVVKPIIGLTIDKEILYEFTLPDGTICKIPLLGNNGEQAADLIKSYNPPPTTTSTHAPYDPFMNATEYSKTATVVAP